ncbi:MAG TPA: SGNH/GDSL hydrolase family protein [Verrucomicrobiae bacterium]|nr:SGNH/GDSL hydrolase family protein [Verrucomicrobiae bacterium]
MKSSIAGILFLGITTWVNAQPSGGAKPVVPAPPKQAPVPADVAWHDVTTWGVEGRGWADQERARWFDRFPAKAEGKVPPAVWGLSRDSSGMMARFRTDATAIYARYKLSKANLAMPHMPATGVSGLDLYARDERGKWRWVFVTKPDKQSMEVAIITDLAPGEREYAAYLPLYNGVDSLEIGVPPGAKFEALAPRDKKPIVFYGTSITHGACASRPGMVHTAILGRRFDRPVINLGFSGNGRMDASVGELMCEIDAAAFVIDCLPNMDAKAVAERAVPLVKQLRAARPDAAIVLVEDRPFTNSWIRPSRQEFHAANHAALKRAFEELKEAGVPRLYYLFGDNLLGDDAEGATDASHPNDLGFMRQADAFEPVLRAALGMR